MNKKWKSSLSSFQYKRRVCRNNFRWTTTWYIDAWQTFGRRPLDYYATEYVLQCMYCPVYRGTCCAFLTLLDPTDFRSTGMKRRQDDSLVVLLFCVISKRCITSALSISFDKQKVYWMLNVMYGSPLCSCVRHIWCFSVCCLVLRQLTKTGARCRFDTLYREQTDKGERGYCWPGVVSCWWDMFATACMEHSLSLVHRAELFSSTDVSSTSDICNSRVTCSRRDISSRDGRFSRTGI